MKLFLIIIVFGVFGTFVFACDSKLPDQKSPKNAFACLAPCVNNEDAICLFDLLDRNSKWSLQTIYRILAETKTLVEKSYPKDEKIRNTAFGIWKNEAKAENYKQMFAIFCKHRNCLRQIIGGFGAVTKVEIKQSNAKITTTRNETFDMSADDGQWGLSTYKNELQTEKIRLGDNLKQVKRNAADYDEQRRAIGAK